MQNKPIFLVGTPRSGTTLTAAILSAHSRLSCGPETHFFSHLTPKKEKAILYSKTWPKEAFNFILSLKLTNKPIYQLYNLTPSEIYTFLSSKRPSIATTLESLTLLYAKKHNKKRWIEKTPIHLRYVSKIFQIFPDSRIIRIIRDPRDCAISLTKVPWGYKSLICGIFRCLEDDLFISSFEKKIFSFKFENLLLEPEKIIKRICKYSDENFEENMLKFYIQAQEVKSSLEWWKKNIEKPLDTSRYQVWKKELDKEMIQILTYFGSYIIKKYNYEIDIPTFKECIFIFPLSFNFLENNQEFFIKCNKNNIKITGCYYLDFLEEAIKRENPDKILFLYPITTKYFRNFNSIYRTRNILSFIRKIIKVKKILFIQKKQDNSAIGKTEKIINSIILTFGKKIYDIEDIF